jgi:uncharacterized membrane protein (UPF0127 family)
LRVRFRIGLAPFDRSRVVIGIARLRAYRDGRPRWRTRSVLEAVPGAFERCRLVVGDTLEPRA